ncbi:P-loop containing nucleoside triphosphate hydrolase protein [Ceratobasidium sp. AG-I]|nr:P-loop containing nucleoside triphosphate hydrolase protein [Ceratobasidium sp. AG-I]
MSATSSLGRWPVILSGRAIRKLRVLAKDKQALDIVHNKLRELSHGKFTAKNHLVIRGSGEYIPLHRARLRNNLRIVYQIDVMPDSQNQSDHQVIKVYLVSSRERVDYNFWVKVSKCLAQQGDLYRTRCTRREVLRNTGGVIYIPARFPHEEYSAKIASTVRLIDESHSTELHETLALERFTPVTKALYNSILADMDIMLPMVLSADERAIVRHCGTSVVMGRGGSGKSTVLIYKMRANAQLSVISGNETPIRQLFVTRSRVLTQHIARNYQGLVDSNEMADKTLEELAEMRKNNETNQQHELVEFDNEVDLRDDLPNRFSELQDSHFPLFVSFDKLCSLLEADLLDHDADVLLSPRYKTQELITFSDFKRKYWPRFKSDLTRGLDPGLVFSEILGVIKGCRNNLSKEEYLSGTSHRRSPLLSNVRRQVYDIFEAYSKKSQSWSEIDAADRTRRILHKYSQSPKWQVDYIFVDEVQDHLMVDIHLLQSLCSNPDGSYWCGDTAQTINVGSSFRIKELKAFIYQDLYPKQKSLNHKSTKATAPFSEFELTVNFRSHGGIVRYAASIIELIYTLFPNAIDYMEPETAKVPGKPPLLFIGSTGDESNFVHHLLGEKPLNQAVPLGAHQAILVRSEATAQSLNKRFDNSYTVLTILDAKGVEFDDVIIYNFFSESEASILAWKKILKLSPEDHGERVTYHVSGPLPVISPVLCSELKQLYVAITRARHRCWLWDSGAAIDLMKTFWSTCGLLAISDSLTALGGFAAKPSTPQQWVLRGQQFFSNSLYALAESCFDRAGQHKEATIANAYHHMSKAKQLQGEENAIEVANLLAAIKMVSCAESDKSSNSATLLWYHAGGCFEAARVIPLASKCYREGEFYDRALLVSFCSHDIDDCLLTLIPHYDRVEESLREKITQACRVHYLETYNYKYSAIPLLKNVD